MASLALGIHRSSSRLLSRRALVSSRSAYSTGTNAQAGPPRRSLMQAWFAVEAIPIYVIIGGAMVGAGWYLFRLSRQPDVIWSKSNPTPWNTVEQNQNTKMLTGNQKFEKSWSRG